MKKTWSRRTKKGDVVAKTRKRVVYEEKVSKIPKPKPRKKKQPISVVVTKQELRCSSLGPSEIAAAKFLDLGYSGEFGWSQSSEGFVATAIW